MNHLIPLVTLTFAIGLAFGWSPVDLIVPSLEDFVPADSGTWYYSHTTIAFIPFPFLPHYKLDCQLVDVPNGKQLQWTAFIGDGVTKGIIFDTTSDRYSTCETTEAASDPVSIGVQGILTAFCGQIRSLRRIDEVHVQAVVLCPSGSESVYFQHTKPNLMESFLPFGLGSR